jgi:hypothetical protein
MMNAATLAATPSTAIFDFSFERFSSMAYTPFDRFVSWCRFRAAAPHIRIGSVVCDWGRGAGAPFLEYVESRHISGVGLDQQVGVSPPAEVLTRAKVVNHELGFDQHQPKEKLKEMLAKVGFTQFEDGRFEMGLNN